MSLPEPTIKEIREASLRIAPHVHRTPVLTCTNINHLCGAELFFKCENLQKVGAFKMRGASNAVFSLTEKQASRGVATHSSGNHGAALACAAQKRNIRSFVVMPENSPQVKQKAVASYGAEIIFCKPTLRAREEGLRNVVDQTGAQFIHPYNDYRVIAGQGTAALELLEDIPSLDTVITPVGGGGLLSGTAITVNSLSPEIRIVGAEPAGADDAFRSLKAGHIIPMENPNTIADGLRSSLGDKTFPIIQRLVSEIITVPDDIIIEAMRLIWERMKIIAEPSAAVTLGAVLNSPLKDSGKKVGLILSGGNVDLNRLPWSPR